MYWVYILHCNDNTFYTGITTDLQRRVAEHNTTQCGAKYTRYRRPVTLVYSKQYNTRSEALKAEASIKQKSRDEKLDLIGIKNDDLH